MNRPLPRYAVLLGLGGLLPFILCSAGALLLPQPSASLSLLALTAYGATILAFLGGVHWGFALDGAGSPDERTQVLRFGLGVVPSLIGWVALLAAFAGQSTAGLLVLMTGFAATTAIEAQAASSGSMPRPYMRLRWALSGGVLVCLLVVLVMG